MKDNLSESEFFGTESIGRILLKIAPPVMLAQLIQALYNIVDSFFVGMYSNDALTALTVIYPLQLIIVALAVGTGVGINTYMARKYSQGRFQEANETAGTGTVLALISWILFAVISNCILRPYIMTSAKTPAAIEDAVVYGTIVCTGSLGSFLEGGWSKVHQAGGNMRVPMIGQVCGALTNIILDPLLIFGVGPLPQMGVAGAAYATIAGQFVAAIITGVKGFRKPPRPSKMLHYANRIYFYGYSNICMQLLYTVYIVALNMILAKFSDAAVTVLGLYYKLQSFFFVPLFGLQTCVVPVLSFNLARASYDRCKDMMKKSFLISAGFMLVGMICFIGFPVQSAGLFSKSAEVLQIAKVAFPIIGSSFLFAVLSLMTPVFFQTIGDGLTSLFLTLLRQIFCLVPIFWMLSLMGVNYTWIAFPVAEFTAGGVGYLLYKKKTRSWNTPVDRFPGSMIKYGCMCKSPAVPSACRENRELGAIPKRFRRCNHLFRFI